jgi:hypothetical protein
MFSKSKRDETINWLTERERVNASRGNKAAAKDCREMRALVERRHGKKGT